MKYDNSELRAAIDNCALRVNTLAADMARRIRKDCAVAPSSKGEDKDIGAALFRQAYLRSVEITWMRV